jgi:transposase
MKRYPEDAWERAMKVQEVILRAMAKRITWWQAAEILGISVRSMRRWRWRYDQHGYDGLFDRRRPGGRSSRALPAFLAGNFPRRGLKSPAGIQTHA